MLAPIVLTVIFFTNLLILSFVLWIAGLIVVGAKHAKFFHAILLAFVGTIVVTFFLTLIPIVGLFLALIAWLALIKFFYGTGWLGALAVSVLAIIVMIGVFATLGFLMGIILLPHPFRFI